MDCGASITVALAVGKPDFDAVEAVMRHVWADSDVLTPDAEADRVVYLLAWKDTKPVGTLRLCFSGPDVHLERLSVLMDHRSCGIAQQLVRAAFAEASAAGCRRAVGLVRHRHLRPWGRLGIQADGSTALHRGGTAHLLVRHLVLEPSL